MIFDRWTCCLVVTVALAGCSPAEDPAVQVGRQLVTLRNSLTPASRKIPPPTTQRPTTPTPDTRHPTPDT